MKTKLLICLAIVTLPTGLRAQQYDSVTTRVVAPGVTYKRLVVLSGPWRVNELEIDLRQPGLKLLGVKAKDSFLGREKPSAMAARYAGPGKVVAAVNTDFFAVKTGETENNVVIEGDMSEGVALDGLNFRPPYKNYVALFTGFVGDSSPLDALHHDVVNLPLKLVSRNANTRTFGIAGTVSEGSRAALTSGALLVAEGGMRDSLRAMVKRGGQIRVTTGLNPDHGDLRTVVGGGLELFGNGRSVAEWSDIEEGTFPRFSAGRHPRTGTGISHDGNTLYLMTVDGRRESDGGMSLVELAHFMIGLGAYNAMNFDGGGSTTMVVEGQVVNHPSDTAGERPVGSALLVISGATGKIKP